MRNVLIFLILMALVVCPPPEFNREERQNRRKEFQKQMVDCLLNSEGISADFKKQIEDNKDDDLRKVLHLYITKLDTNDREIIRKCRRELFGKMRQQFSGRFHHHVFNHTGTRPPNEHLRPNNQ